MTNIANIVVFASGGGSNFQSIIDAIQSGYINANIKCLIIDRDCKASNIAEKNNISFHHIDRKNNKSINATAINDLCESCDLIVLAGYLSILNEDVIKNFPKKIINIHPSLLPKFGGKGMYGIKVHQAVIESSETQSGCSVHYVDIGIDTGNIISQAIVDIEPTDTANTLQQKIIKKEHQLLPQTIKQLIENTL